MTQSWAGNDGKYVTHHATGLVNVSFHGSGSYWTFDFKAHNGNELIPAPTTGP